MNHDISNLVHWLHVFVIIAAVCATAFVILYAFLPWYASPLGRMLMLLSFSYALAIDMTCLFFYWHPSDILVEFWIDVIVFALIAIASTALIIMLVRAIVGRRVQVRRP